jgi:hypothetical protein
VITEDEPSKKMGGEKEDDERIDNNEGSQCCELHEAATQGIEKHDTSRVARDLSTDEMIWHEDVRTGFEHLLGYGREYPCTRPR